MADEEIKSAVLKLAIEDSSFSAGMKNLKQQITMIDSGFKASVAGVKDWGSTLDGLKANTESLGQKITVQKQIIQAYTDQLTQSKANMEKHISTVTDLTSKLEAAKSAYERSKSAVGANNEATKQLKANVDDLAGKLSRAESAVVKNQASIQGYTIQANKATGTLNSMESELKDATSKIETFGTEVKEAGDKTDDMGKKGLSAGDLIKANLTSQAIISGVKALANAAGSAAREFKDIVLAASDYGSEINDTSAKTGMATGSLQQWRYAAKLCGVESDKLTSIMVKQQKSFSDANEGSKTASAAYQRLGINIKKVGNSSDAFDLVMEKLAGMKDETTRNALANDIFGKSYADLSPLLAEGADGMDKLKQKAQDLGIVMSDKAVKAADDFGDSLDTLKSAFGGLKNNLSGEFLPAITVIMDGMTQVMTGDTDAGIKAIKDGITDFGTQIDKMGPYAKQALDLVVQVITDNLPSVVECSGKVITSLIDGLCKEMPELTPTVIDIILSIVNTLTDPKNLNNLTNGAVAIITQLALGLIAAMPKLIEKVPEIIENIVDTLTSKENLSKIGESGIEIVRSLWNGILSMGDWLGSKMDDFVSTYIHDHFVNSFGTGVHGTGSNSGGGRVNGSHAMGLDYVPFDGYIAELHKGERVLTKNEAKTLDNFVNSDIIRQAKSLRVQAAGAIQTLTGQVASSPSAKAASASGDSLLASIDSMLTGAVNAMSVASGGTTQAQPATIILKTANGREIARWLLSDIRAVSKSNPEVVNDF